MVGGSRVQSRVEVLTCERLINVYFGFSFEGYLYECGVALTGLMTFRLPAIAIWPASGCVCACFVSLCLYVLSFLPTVRSESYLFFTNHFSYPILTFMFYESLIYFVQPSSRLHILIINMEIYTITHGGELIVVNIYLFFIKGN